MEEPMNPMSGEENKEGMESDVTPAPVVEGEDSEEEEGDKPAMPVADEAEEGEKPDEA